MTPKVAARPVFHLGAWAFLRGATCYALVGVPGAPLPGRGQREKSTNNRTNVLAFEMLLKVSWRHGGIIGLRLAIACGAMRWRYERFFAKNRLWSLAKPFRGEREETMISGKNGASPRLALLPSVAASIAFTRKTYPVTPQTAPADKHAIAF